MKRLFVKYVISSLILIALATAVCLLCCYLWLNHAVKDNCYNALSQCSSAIGELMDDKLTDSKSIKINLDEIISGNNDFKSILFQGKNKNIIARSFQDNLKAVWPFEIVCEVFSGEKVVGFLKVNVYSEMVVNKLQQKSNLAAIIIIFFSWWALVGILLLGYLRKKLYIPLRQLEDFIGNISKENNSPVEFNLNYGAWKKLSDGLNKINERILDTDATFQMLFSVSKTLTAHVETNDIFNIIAKIIQKKLEDVSCSLIVLGEDGFLKIRTNRGLSHDVLKGFHVKPGEGFAGQAFDKCSMIVVNDTSKENIPVVNDLLEQDRVKSFIYIPLVIDSKCEGILNVNSTEKEYFTKDKIKTLSTLAEYLGIALKNAQLYERVQELNRRLETEVSITTRELIQTNSRLIQKVREMKALSDIAAYTAVKGNLSDIIEMIVDKIKDLLSAQSVGILLYSVDTNELVPYPPFFGVRDQEFSRLRFRLDDVEILKSVLKERKNYISNDPQEARDVIPILSKLMVVNSIILVPLRSGNKPIGVLGVINKFGGALNNDDVRILELIADRVSGIIANVNLYQELEHRLHDLTALQDISSSISSEPVWEKTLKKIIETATQAFEADLCALLYFDELNNELVTQLGAHFTGGDEAVLLRIPVNDPNSLSAQVFRSGESFLSPDASLDLRIKSQTARLWDVRSLILVPLKVDNRVIGVLRIGKHKANCFNKDHLRLAALIAHQSAIIIENAHLYDSLRETKSELEDLNKIKNEFISIVSHELRTPITTIKGFVKVVLAGEVGILNEQQEKFLTIVDQSVDRLTILVSDLLDISRIESGQFKLTLLPVNTKEIVEAVVSNMTSEVVKKNIKLITDFPKKFPLVLADRERLMQVFDNLVANSIKFTPENGTITISGYDKGDLVVFSVMDSGMGIDKKEHQKIFEKFYQVDSGLARKINGTGLGLAIVKSIVEIHGGLIWVESEAGKGSNFQFIIPRAKVEIKDYRKNIKDVEEPDNLDLELGQSDKH